MLQVGLGQGLFSRFADFPLLSVMHYRRGQERDPGMMVAVVVPVKESEAKSTRVLDGAEPFRELGPVFEGFELGLGEGVVVGDIRPTPAFGDPQVGEKERHGFGFHGRASVGVDDQLLPVDFLFLAGFLDQKFRQFPALPPGNHPSRDIAAEDVQDHVEIEAAPFHGAEQLGDVPAPDLVGFFREQLGLLILGMLELVSSLPDFSLGFKDSVDGSDGALINTLIQQVREGLRGRLVHIFGRVESEDDLLALRLAQTSSGLGPGFDDCRVRPHLPLLFPVEA